jgi:hypothetical protein
MAVPEFNFAHHHVGAAAMADTEKTTSNHMDAPSLQQIPTNDDVADLEKTVQVDTVHTDEAMKVLAAYSGPLEWTPQEEKRLVRRIDFKLLSILCLTYALQFYDKGMLSQAVRRTCSSSLRRPLTELA